MDAMGVMVMARPTFPMTVLAEPEMKAAKPTIQLPNIADNNTRSQPILKRNDTVGDVCRCGGDGNGLNLLPRYYSSMQSICKPLKHAAVL